MGLYKDRASFVLDFHGSTSSKIVRKSLNVEILEKEDGCGKRKKKTAGAISRPAF